MTKQEIRFKQWIMQEAERCKRSVSTIYRHRQLGKYRGLKIRRINKRVIFVKVSEH